MKLATASKVLASQGVTSNDGSLASANSALDLSFPIIETFLETELQNGNRTDYFSISETSMQQFRLTSSFVSEYDFVVKESLDYPLDSAQGGVVIPPADYIMDYTKGVLTMLRPIRRGPRMLSITYYYGLEADDNDETLLVAPYWLAEAAVTAAIMVLNSVPSSPANRKDKTVNNVVNEIHRPLTYLLNSRRRPRLCVEYPVVSEKYE